MAKDYDEIFLRAATQLQALTPEQIRVCREALARLEAAERPKLIALVAVDEGFLTFDRARGIVEAIHRTLPGRHPALAEDAFAAARAPAPAGASRVRRSGAASAVRRASASRGDLRPPAPARRGKGPLVALGVAGLALVLGGGGLAVARLGAGTKRPPPAPARESAPEGTAAAGAGPAREAVAEAAEERAKAPPVSEKPKPPDPKPAADAEREAFKARLAQRRQKARERVDEVKRELAEERKVADAAEEALRKRLAARPLALALRTGETHARAVVRRYTLHDADVEVEGRPIRVVWDALTPESALAAADGLFDPKSPKEQFDRGRFFIARRNWKEARASFERAAALGDGYESRVSELREVLDRLVSGQVSFRGAARRVGAEGVLITYDFSDVRQLEDFTPGLVLSGGAAVLESKQRAGVRLQGGESDTPLTFFGEFSAEMKLTSDGPVTFGLFAGAKGGYELEVGPAGAALFRAGASAKDRRPVARSDKVKLAPGQAHEFRLHASQWKFTVSLDRGEPAALEDPPQSADQDLPHGAFTVRIEKGRLAIGAPLLIQGRMHRAELDKRLGEVEVKLRRALDPQLEEIRERRERKMAMDMIGEGRTLRLSSDDPFYTSRIRTISDLVEKYEELKRSLGRYFLGQIPDDWNLEKWREGIDALLAKYPDVPSLWYLRALHHQERQLHDASRKDLARALELYPEFYEALTRDARLRLSEFDLDGALQSANRALDVMPDYAEAYIVRALVTFTRSPAAVESFTEDLELARRLDPEDTDAGYYQRVLTQQARGPRDLGCRFDLETAHYLVTTDISPEAARRYGEGLEAAWRHFSETLKDVPVRRPGLRKPRVAIFNTAENYYTYFELISESRGEHTLGVFRPGLNELVLFETLDLEDTLHTLYHEAFHHYMMLLLGERAPSWLNEGMAEYMGAIDVKDGRVVRKAKLLRGRLLAARLLIEVNSTIPFKKLMGDTSREFYGTNAGLKYAQAWSMIHFFHEYDGGKYRPLVVRYLRSLQSGRSAHEAYEEVFAPKVEALEREWKEFTRSLKP
jgi:tetratricopeptide (TPR) repeat protein